MLREVLLAHPAPGQELPQRRDRYRGGARPQRHRGADPLAERPVRDRDGRHLRHRRMRRYLRLDRRGADVLAAADDEVGLAPRDPDIAGGVHRDQVRQQLAAVGMVQLRGGVGIAVVAARHAGTGAAGLAGVPGGGDVGARVVVNPVPDAGQHPPGGGAPGLC